MSASEEFKKAGTVFKPVNSMDKREAFEREVEPLVKAAVDKIQELGLAFVFGIATGYDKAADNISTLIAYGHGDDQYMPPGIAMAAIAMDTEHSGCLSCFIKEAIHSGLINPSDATGKSLQALSHHLKGTLPELMKSLKPSLPHTPKAPAADAATNEALEKVKKDFHGKN